MDKKEKKPKATSAGPQAGWAISLEWLAQNNRSLAALAQGYLCPKCAKKLSAKRNKASPQAIIAAIRDCCSRSRDFINIQMPVLESIFRLFLTNGNQPLPLEELSRELNERRGGDVYRTSPEILLRLLKSDSYYGLQETKAE
jgi:hypothetical protein